MDTRETPFKLVMAMTITRKILASPEKWTPGVISAAQYFYDYMEKTGLRYWSDPNDTLTRFEINCISWKAIIKQLPDDYREQLAGE